MKTPLRNIHTQPSRSSRCESASALPRLRDVQNDPAREFAARPGATRQLSNEIVAVILFRQEFREVGREGITVNGRKYWHDNSIICATKAGAKERVLVTYNRHDPTIIHILTRDGAYIESIPEKGHAQFFDPAATRKELAAVRRDQHRVMKRMEEIHGPDTLETLARERDNLAQTKRVVSTFDSPVGTVAPRGPLSMTNPARQIARAEKTSARNVAADKKQRAKHSRTIQREGAAAARDILSHSANRNGQSESEITDPDAGAALLSILAGENHEP